MARNSYYYCIPTNHPGISGNIPENWVASRYPENCHKSREVLRSAQGQDAHAFGLPVARIVGAHIVTLDLHELSAAKTATEQSLHQDHH